LPEEPEEAEEPKEAEEATWRHAARGAGANSPKLSSALCPPGAARPGRYYGHLPSWGLLAWPGGWGSQE
jgi:hypothetical protein